MPKSHPDETGTSSPSQSANTPRYNWGDLTDDTQRIYAKRHWRRMTGVPPVEVIRDGVQSYLTNGPRRWSTSTPTPGECGEVADKKTGAPAETQEKQAHTATPAETQEKQAQKKVKTPRPRQKRFKKRTGDLGQDPDHDPFAALDILQLMRRLQEISSRQAEQEEEQF